jgi:hypothetical protein
MITDINNADETGLFSSLQPSKTLSFQGHFFHDVEKSKQLFTVLHAFSEGGSYKLPF